MGGKTKPKKAAYTQAEDDIIKRLYRKAWSKFEIAYRLNTDCSTSRSILSISQRTSVLIQAGEVEGIERGKRFVTQEALDWVNKVHKLKQKPSRGLDLREHKTGPWAKGKKAKGNDTKKASSREVLGFTKTKHKDEPNPSYAVKAVRMAKMDGDPLNMFRDLLESGVAEGKTAPDILDDLRLFGT
jgi:hypothetical protein